MFALLGLLGLAGLAGVTLWLVLGAPLRRADREDDDFVHSEPLPQDDVEVIGGVWPVEHWR